MQRPQVIGGPLSLTRSWPARVFPERGYFKHIDNAPITNSLQKSLAQPGWLGRAQLTDNNWEGEVRGESLSGGTCLCELATCGNSRRLNNGKDILEVLEDVDDVNEVFAELQSGTSDSLPTLPHKLYTTSTPQRSFDGL